MAFEQYAKKLRKIGAYTTKIAVSTGQFAKSSYKAKGKTAEGYSKRPVGRPPGASGKYINPRTGQPVRAQEWYRLQRAAKRAALARMNIARLRGQYPQAYPQRYPQYPQQVVQRQPQYPQRRIPDHVVGRARMDNPVKVQTSLLTSRPAMQVNPYAQRERWTL